MELTWAVANLLFMQYQSEPHSLHSNQQHVTQCWISY